MKRKVLLTVLVLVLTLPVFAQEKSECHKEVDKKELQAKIMKMKKATFTQNLKLTKEESEKFWTLYEAYDAELNKTIEKAHAVKSKYKNVEDIKEGDAENIIKIELETEKNILTIKTSYYERFQEVLPKEKVAKLILEEKKLMHQLRKKEQGKKKPELQTPELKQAKGVVNKKQLQPKVDK